MVISHHFKVGVFFPLEGKKYRKYLLELYFECEDGTLFLKLHIHQFVQSSLYRAQWGYHRDIQVHSFGGLPFLMYSEYGHYILHLPCPLWSDNW